jgi:hypothetical protein
MLRFLIILSFAIVSISAHAADEAKEVKLAVGFGFHLCRHEDVPPPLERAFLCPGLQATLRNVIVTMQPEKIANPKWKLWSGRIMDKVMSLDGIEFSYELLVASALIDNIESSFIDGRMTNSKTGAPSYFRVSVQGSFAEMDGTYHYSLPISITAKTGELMDLSSVLAISKAR